MVSRRQRLNTTIVLSIGAFGKRLGIGKVIAVALLEEGEKPDTGLDMPTPYLFHVISCAISGLYQ
jgi:hypothetical protein